MSWERRRRGTRYYTRSRRIGGRIVREYVGRGLVGELAAAQDEARRAEQAEARRRQAAEEARAAASIAPLQALMTTTEQAMRVMLTAAGYRLHRGEWRRRQEARA